MKCKDCGSTLCIYRTCGDERDCFYESHPDYTLPKDFGCDFRNNIDWHSLRNHAAIAAMQGLLCAPSYEADRSKLNMIAEDAISIADALIKELKKK